MQQTCVLINFLLTNILDDDQCCAAYVVGLGRGAMMPSVAMPTQMPNQPFVTVPQMGGLDPGIPQQPILISQPQVQVEYISVRKLNVIIAEMPTIRI